MLSAHAIPCNSNWLQALLQPMLEDEKIVGVYGKQVPMRSHLSNKIVKVLAEAYPQCYTDKAYITNRNPFFSNANAAIRIENWKENQFDEVLSGAEDQKWAMNEIKKVIGLHISLLQKYIIRIQIL